MKYEINIYKYFWKSIIKTLFYFVVGVTLLIYFKEISNFKEILKISIVLLFFCWFPIVGFPTIYLFIKHFRFNKNSSFKINKTLFEYSNKNKIISFSILDIENIELWLTPMKFDKRTDWQFFGEYNFSRFKLKNGKFFDVSCLTFDKTEDIFPRGIILKKKKFFPIPLADL